MELTSTYVAGEPQADGRRSIKETHLASDGQRFEYDYLAGPKVNPDIVLEERAKIILVRLEEREASLLEVVGTTVPLTKFQFVNRMTREERIAVRARCKVDPDAEDFMYLMELSAHVNLVLARDGLAYLSHDHPVHGATLTPERAAVIGAE